MHIDGQYYKFELNAEGDQMLLSFTENKDLVKKLFDGISSIKWDLSERIESMSKLKNLFISPYEVKLLKKEFGLIEKKVNQLEDKAKGMFKSPIYES